MPERWLLGGMGLYTPTRVTRRPQRLKRKTPLDEKSRVSQQDTIPPGGIQTAPYSAYSAYRVP
nr:MAG TPA: hypothetical protein [Caudoviricetes sp.]